MPVEVKGVIELRKALRQFSPDLAKELTKEMGGALKPVVKKARSFLPSNDSMISNWVGLKGRADNRFPQYDASVARKGITYSTSPAKANKRGFRSLATIYNKSAAGAIYETAGRKRPNSLFVKNLEAKTNGIMRGQDKMRGRVIFRAWEEDNGVAQDAVMRAIMKAKDLFEARKASL